MYLKRSSLQANLQPTAIDKGSDNLPRDFNSISRKFIPPQKFKFLISSSRDPYFLNFKVIQRRCKLITYLILLSQLDVY